MHAVLITFRLSDMTAERYAEVCVQLAPSFAALPGLLTKVWLGGPEDDGRGGLYLFADPAAADCFLASTLAHGVARNPHFADLTVRRFDVDETVTALTQPGITVVRPVPASIAAWAGIGGTGRPAVTVAAAVPAVPAARAS